MAGPPVAETLETVRLTLRPVGHGDVAHLTAWWNDPTVRRKHGLGLEPLPEDAVRLWLDTPTRAFAWLARDRTSGEAVGVVEMSPLSAGGAAGAGGDGGAFELGIAVAAAARGHGLGREMIDGLCAWAFERRGARAVVAEVRADNGPALRAFAACGFAREGRDGDVVRMRRRRVGES